jgi:Icc-related predicted phosphoesterase
MMMNELSMRILHLSDTHGRHHALNSLPDADIIVHSGDFTYGGSEAEAYDFINWFSDLPYEHKIFISGNHDMCMYGVENIDGLPDNVHYLCNSGITIDGMKFYGLPMFMEDYLEGRVKAMFDSVPDDTNILITHQPPYGICDLADYGKGLQHQGNRNLAERLKRLYALRYHLFGHEHSAYGIERYEGVIFSNAALLTPEYEMVRQPIVIEVRGESVIPLSDAS